MLRNAVVYGGFLFPYRSVPGIDGDAARALLAENAVSLPASIGAFGSRIWNVVTLQPEAGITLLVVVLGLFGRVRNLWFWALAAVAVLTPVATSANAHNTLRWAQPGLVLIILAAAINLASAAPRRGPVRWATAAFLIASLALSVAFVVRTTGPFPHLLMTEERFLDDRIPTFSVRQNLMGQPGRVLWVGELYGYYGAAKGPIPAPQNGAYFSRYLGAGSPEEIQQILTQDGYWWMTLNRRHRATAPGSQHWSWMTDEDRRAVEALLGRLPAEYPMDGVAVYRITPRGESPPSSP